MFGSIIKKIVGTKNDRELNRLAPLVDQINDLEPEIRKLGDAQLKGQDLRIQSNSWPTARPWTSCSPRPLP